jgi:hypothetical protein
MTTLLLILGAILTMIWFIAAAVVLVLISIEVRMQRKRTASYVEIIPRDATSHSDRNMFEPTSLSARDVRVSEIMR